MSRRLLVALLFPLCPISVAGQLMPGGKGVDVDAQQAQFNGVMVKVVRAATEAWQDAWPKSTDTNLVAERYHEEATILQFGGPLISGQQRVRAFTDSLRSRVRAATLAFTDFEASEGIAYIYGPLLLESRTGGLDANGQHLTVLRRDKKGFLIRSQLLIAQPGAPRLPHLAAQHPSGPLTVQAMTNAPTVARYRSANDVLNRLHVAWSQADTVGVFELFDATTLVQLPGQPTSLRGLQAREAISVMMEAGGDLHFVTLDYDSSGRLGALVGQYYLERNGADPLNGYFGLILTWRDNGWKIRSLVFA